MNRALSTHSVYTYRTPSGSQARSGDPILTQERRREINALINGFSTANNFRSQRLVAETQQLALTQSRIDFAKFEQPMPLPPVKEPTSIGFGNSPWNVGDCFHGVAPEYFHQEIADQTGSKYLSRYPIRFYDLQIQNVLSEFVPGVKTPCVGYDGLVPGPTFRSRGGGPMVVRTQNSTPFSCSRHLHGAHNPSHSDGHPQYYVIPDQERDYYYPNMIPRQNGIVDSSEAPSTMCYYDLGMEANEEGRSLGMMGFHLQTDELERTLINRAILPIEEFDIPILIDDKRFNSDGTLFLGNQEEGDSLGDIYCLNGKAHPHFRVKRRKYRLRFLNASRFRYLELRLSDHRPFLAIGNDSWLYPRAIERDTLLLPPTKRADVILDFSKVKADELYLENVLVQEDEHGPSGTLDRPSEALRSPPLMQFILEGPPAEKDCSVQSGTELRMQTPLDETDVEVTRIFKIQGSQECSYSTEPLDLNSCISPRVGSMERWVLRNHSHRTCHSIHPHLGSHRIETINGETPPAWLSFKNDVSLLRPQSEMEILIPFKTFQGPFTCHSHCSGTGENNLLIHFDCRSDGSNACNSFSAHYP